MTRFGWGALVFVGSVVLAVACGDDDTGSTTSSSSSGKPGTSTSGDIGGGSSSGTSGSGTSSGSSSLTLTPYATAICEKIEKCQPGAFDQSWASKTECVAEVEGSNRQGVSALPGSKISQQQVDACAAQIKDSSCAFGLGDLDACVLKGTLDPGAPCYDGRQCQSGRCKRTQLSAQCGTCATFEPAGGTCIEDPDCLFGLFCDQPENGAGGKCVTLPAKGESCTTVAKRCAAGLVCANDKCADPVDKDGPCTATGNECRRGLVCTSNVCKDFAPKVAALGDACDATTTCRKSSCRGQPGAEKCVGYAIQGSACSDSRTGAPECDRDSFCTDGTCEGNTYPACN